MRRPVFMSIFLLQMAWSPNAPAQEPAAIYDEALVPAYTLPDPLLCRDGTRVASAAEWTAKRRPELVRLFEEHVYGRTPDRAANLRFNTVSEEPALGGRAVRRQIEVRFAPDAGPVMTLLVYRPAGAPGPFPVFLGLNFDGNHSVHKDPGILVTRSWLENFRDFDTSDTARVRAFRGSESGRWPVERILERGYALATAWYEDIDPDFDDGFQNGVHPLFRTAAAAPSDSGGWGTIAAWAWGLSRALDVLEKEPSIDAGRATVLGHSRLGKAALWAAVLDERFALAVSNESGCGGAALSKRVFGETVERINTIFPHWFCDRFNRYNGREAGLPVDQHELLALIAPRPLYVASAAEDLWADPRGEFLSALNAGPVYGLFGLEGLGVSEMPGLNRPVGRTIGYHVRAGKHDVTGYDWERYLDFADRHFWGR